jgi:hypothetical protein
MLSNVQGEHCSLTTARGTLDILRKMERFALLQFISGSEERR